MTTNQELVEGTETLTITAWGTVRHGTRDVKIVRKVVRSYHFRTVHEGVIRPYAILGTSVRDAVNTLRLGLYDGETIVGWA